jgi:hypothetical protein
MYTDYYSAVNPGIGTPDLTSKEKGRGRGRESF